MKKLELKHLTPYLPYSLKVIMEGKKCNVTWMSTKNIAVHRPEGIGDYKRIQWKYAHLNIKPILRPLSDLTKEILEEYNFIRRPINSNEIDCNEIDFYSYGFMKYCFENHFDVFGLIPKGLAIDINTLKN